MTAVLFGWRGTVVVLSRCPWIVERGTPNTPAICRTVFSRSSQRRWASAARSAVSFGRRLVLLSVAGALGVLAWLWTIRVVNAGKRWARPASTVVFALGTSAGSTGLLTQDTSGATGLPATLGWAGMAPCPAGMPAVTLLWRRPRPV